LKRCPVFTNGENGFDRHACDVRAAGTVGQVWFVLVGDSRTGTTDNAFLPSTQSRGMATSPRPKEEVHFPGLNVLLSKNGYLAQAT